MAEKEYIDLETVYDMDTLEDWYINSVSDNDTPVWTEEHLEELLNDFYVIPKDTTTADVAPVRHGRWKKSKGNERPTKNGFVHDDKYVCDCCGWGCCCETKLDFSFCPNCGAKMDGGD